MAAPAKRTLQVSIQHAQMLPNVDGFLAGKSDPYVICHIPGKRHSTMQTPTIQDNLNPQWNHTDLLHDYAPEDSLEFQVWDKNNFPMPDKKIGHVTLTPADFAANPYGMEGELALEDCKAAEATLAFQLHVLEGDVQSQQVQDEQVQHAQHAQAQQAVDPSGSQVYQHPQAADPYINQVYQQPQTGPASAAQYGGQPPFEQLAVQATVVPAAHAGGSAPPTNKLRVEILHAKMLPNKDSMLSGKSDPYVIAQVPGTGGMFKGKTKITTPVVNNNLNPEWNFTGDIPHFKPEDTLEFEVWDQDSFPKPDQLLGKTQINPQDFYANPDGLEGELPLIGAKGADAGSLAVRVHVLPDDAPGSTAHAVTTSAAAHTATSPQTYAAPTAHAAGAAPRVYGAPTVINATPFSGVPVGSPYHGGILVNERWNPPVLCGHVRPSGMPLASQRNAQAPYAVPMTTPYGVPTTTTSMPAHGCAPVARATYGTPMTTLPARGPAPVARPQAHV